MELKPGLSVTPNVRLVRELGVGGMGSVWVAKHLSLETDVAVKFISQSLAKQEPSLVTRFKREAALAAKIDSPHVVRIFDHGVSEDGTPYIVMELLKGKSLADELDERGPLDTRSARLVLTQLAQVLSTAHRLGIVHRDIKPDNIFLIDSDYDVFVKVLDFGIAKRIEKADKKSFVTSSGAMVGTLEYMSPEQIIDASDVDFRADLWSLAVVAYHALTGEPPFMDPSQFKLCTKICQSQYSPATTEQPSLPPAIDAWFARALHVEPDARFDSARDMVDALTEALGGAGDEDELATSGKPAGDAFDVGDVLGVDEPPGEEESPAAESDASPKAAKPGAGRRRSGPGFEGSPTMSGSATSIGRTLRAQGRRNMALLGAAVVALVIALAVLWRSTGGDDAAPAHAVRESPGPQVSASASASAAASSKDPPKGMARIPARSYWIGCYSDDDKACFTDESPGHARQLAPYGIMVFEVTVAAYRECVSKGACLEPAPDEECTYQNGTDRQPITCVTWDDAKKYCQFRGWRLPTEEEWEAAARGDKHPDYPWGDEPPSCERTVMAAGPDAAGCATGGPREVGSSPKDRSWSGVMDLAGNVREWTATEYAAYPGGYADRDSQGRVNRGGSWLMQADQFSTSHTRGVDSPGQSRPDLGFRCAIDL
jgi:serine/threonine-protein kinase